MRERLKLYFLDEMNSLYRKISPCVSRETENTNPRAKKKQVKGRRRNQVETSRAIKKGQDAIKETNYERIRFSIS